MIEGEIRYIWKKKERRKGKRTVVDAEIKKKRKEILFIEGEAKCI